LAMRLRLRASGKGLTSAMARSLYQGVRVPFRHAISDPSQDLGATVSDAARAQPDGMRKAVLPPLAIDTCWAKTHEPCDFEAADQQSGDAAGPPLPAVASCARSPSSRLSERTCDIDRLHSFQRSSRLSTSPRVVTVEFLLCSERVEVHIPGFLAGQLP